MTRRVKIALWVTGSLVAVAASLWVALVVSWQVAFSGLCANTPIREAWSPSRSHRVIVFERSCGATTGFSTQVSLLRAADTLANEPGDVFRADTNSGVAPAGPGGGPEVRVEWLGETHVRVSHHTKTRVFSANTAIANIRVSYATFE